MDKLTAFGEISNNTIKNKQSTLAIFGDYLQRKTQANNLQVSKYLQQLFKIVGENFITLVPITEEEIISVDVLNVACNVIQKTEDKNTEVDFTNVLAYQLLKSIAIADIRLLNEIKPLACDFVNRDKINAKLQSEIYTFNLIKKMVKMECLKTKFETKVTLKSKDIIGLITEITAKFFSMYVQHSRALQQSYGDYYSKLVNNKLSIYAIYLLVSSTAGIQTYNSFSGNKLDIETLHKIGKTIATVINEGIMRNLCIKENLIETYENYCTKVGETLLEINDNKILPNIPTEVDTKIRELQKDIKDLKSTVYDLQQKIKDKELLYGETQVNYDNVLMNEDENEELKASESIRLDDKFDIIKSKKLAIVTCVQLDSKLNDYCKVIQGEQVKGKNLGKNYDYVVKVTKAMPHSVAYAIKEEIGGNSVKLITTSRTNINLLLDSIIEEL